ncbi:MAG: TIGR01212 family radical SAM protein, partial [Desulfobacterales bacterium]
VILGLPGETRAQMLATADFIADLGIHGVKLHFLYVIKGTALERHYRDNRYRCLSQNQYVDLVCDFLERLPPAMVIQRITGDPHPAELVAPLWALGKSATRNLISERLELRNTWQGRRFFGGGCVPIPC